MRPFENYVRKVGSITLLSGVIAFACNILLALAVNNNFEVFSNPALIFENLRSSQIEFFRWGMITDIWGYYLLFVPIVLFIYEKMESSWRNMFAFCGIAYVVIGAIGAAILAATGSHFLKEFLNNTDMVLQTGAKNDFLLVYHIVNNGIWNLLEMGIFGVFMLGAAQVLRSHGKLIYILTMLLGIAGMMDTLGNTFEIGIWSDIGLNFYLLFEPIWAIWLGIILIRCRNNF
ncbi:MAG: hypothetical protein GC192_06290 [Bacteroidetes bacterium]|nr:hypothetical protein [Bacteroidota bacterium]